MTKQNCTSGPRTTKEKTIAFTRTQWERGDCVFYNNKQPLTGSFIGLFRPQALPFQPFTLEGCQHG